MATDFGSNGSDEYVEHFCHSCKLDKQNIPAEGFCVTCKEYLCLTCFTYHTRPLPTRHHVLLRSSEMPTGHQLLHEQLVKDICLDICLQHHGERQKFYCGSHKEMCCGVCMMQEHTNCDNMKYIPDLQLDTKKEFQDYNKNLKNLKDQLKTNRQNYHTHVKAVKTMSLRARNDIKKFRKEINDFLDKLQIDAEDQLQECETERMSQLHDIEHNVEMSIKCIETLQTKLDDMLKTSDSCQLFVAMKKSSKFIKETEKKLDEGRSKNLDKYFYFQPEQQLKDILLKVQVLGKISG